MTDDRPYMVLLNSDGWRDVAEYVPSRDYVYVKGFAAMAKHPGVGIGRRGKYDNSGWWRPNSEPLPLDVCWWKPFPTDDGISPHQRWLDFIRPQDGRLVRPPEPVYPPAGVDAKLTPVPIRPLLDMHGGVRLHERAWRWTEWTLWEKGEGPATPLNERGINALRKVAFIERDGVLPPGRHERWFEFDWKITDAGKAWIEANTGEKR
jgi:hypothetical protein